MPRKLGPPARAVPPVPSREPRADSAQGLATPPAPRASGGAAAAAAGASAFTTRDASKPISSSEALYQQANKLYTDNQDNLPEVDSQTADLLSQAAEDPLITPQTIVKISRLLDNIKPLSSDRNVELSSKIDNITFPTKEQKLKALEDEIESMTANNASPIMELVESLFTPAIINVLVGESDKGQVVLTVEDLRGVVEQLAAKAPDLQMRCNALMLKCINAEIVDILPENFMNPADPKRGPEFLEDARKLEVPVREGNWQSAMHFAQSLVVAAQDPLLTLGEVKSSTRLRSGLLEELNHRSDKFGNMKVPIQTVLGKLTYPTKNEKLEAFERLCEVLCATPFEMRTPMINSFLPLSTYVKSFITPVQIDDLDGETDAGQVTFSLADLKKMAGWLLPVDQDARHLVMEKAIAHPDILDEDKLQMQFDMLFEKMRADQAQPDADAELIFSRYAPRFKRIVKAAENVKGAEGIRETWEFFQGGFKVD